MVGDAPEQVGPEAIPERLDLGPVLIAPRIGEGQVVRRERIAGGRRIVADPGDGPPRLADAVIEGDDEHDDTEDPGNGSQRTSSRSRRGPGGLDAVSALSHPRLVVISTAPCAAPGPGASQPGGDPKHEADRHEQDREGQSEQQVAQGPGRDPTDRLEGAIHPGRRVGPEQVDEDHDRADDGDQHRRDPQTGPPGDRRQHRRSGHPCRRRRSGVRGDGGGVSHRRLRPW